MEYHTVQSVAASDCTEFGTAAAEVALIKKNFKPSTRKTDTTDGPAPVKKVMSSRCVAKFSIPVSSTTKFQAVDETLKGQLSALYHLIPTLNPSSTSYTPVYTSEQLTATLLLLIAQKACVHQDAEIRVMLVRTVDTVEEKVTSVKSKLVVLINAENEDAMSAVLAVFKQYITVPINVIGETSSTTQHFANLFTKYAVPTDYAVSSTHILSTTTTMVTSRIGFFSTSTAVCSDLHAPASWDHDIEFSLPLKSSASGAGKKRSASPASSSEDPEPATKQQQ